MIPTPPAAVAGGVFDTLAAVTAAPTRRRLLIRSLWLAAGLTVAVGGAAVLWKKLDAHTLHTAWQSLLAFPRTTVLGAIGLVSISFVLASLCEIAGLRAIGKPLGVGRPVLVTAIANPIGHALILPTLSGGALRYRMYVPWGLERGEIARVVLYSALPFVFGVMLLIPIAFLMRSSQVSAAIHLPRVLVLCLGAAGIALAAGYFAFTHSRFVRNKLPGPGLTLLYLVCGIIEILAVAGSLYVFMPHTLGMGLGEFFIVYLIGVLLGQFSSVPAGIGMLEASLIVLLPHVPQGQLLAAAFAYRVVFDLIPLVIGLILLALYEMGSRRGIVGRLWRAPRASE